MNYLVRLHEPEDWRGVALCRSAGDGPKCSELQHHGLPATNLGFPLLICVCRKPAYGELGSALGAQQELLGRVFVYVEQNPFQS